MFDVNVVRAEKLSSDVSAYKECVKKLYLNLMKDFKPSQK